MTQKTEPERTGEFDEAFTTAFMDEIQEKKSWTRRDEKTWRVGGRASKANPEREDPTWWLTEGPHMVERWAAWWEANNFTIWTTPKGRAAIELGIDEISIGGEPFRCFIDAIVVDEDDDLVVLDWKSGSMKPASAFQLGEYACAVEVKYGVRVKWGAYYDARRGELGDLENLDRFTIARVQQSITRSRLIRDQNLLTPHPSSLCSACGVRDWCWAMGGAKADEVPEF